MDYRTLGPLEAFDGERRLSLGGTRQRAVLALLLLHRNEALTRDVIVDQLWGEAPPPTAPKVLQNCVSALRKELPGGSETLRTVGGGYVLRVSKGECDLDRFETLVAEGRAALAEDQPDDAARRLRDALALWRGPPLSDFAYESFAQEEIVRLQELHLAAVEERIEADLALGRHAELVAELEGLVARHPLRERLRGQLMKALYRSGRQAEALAAYHDARRALLGELGIEPGRALQDLQRGILEQDPSLDRPVAAAPAASGGRPDAVRPGRRAAAPFVGRDDELALLDAGLEDALAGRGRLFLVVGGAGAGKTRLADEIASRAKAHGASILWGRGWHEAGAPAYWPWRQALQDAGQTLQEPEAGDADARFRFFGAVTELVRAEAARQPLLLVLDDLEAADEDSLLLLEFLASELPEMAALVVALGREETARLDELARLATRTIQLGSRT
jgi:DNA-binding SARP family transcriptional activator